MTISARFGPLSLLVASACLAVGGGLAANQELNVFAAGGADAATRFRALAAGDYQPGPSIFAQRQLLDSCVEAISGLYGSLRADEDRRPVLEQCLGYADAAAAQNPSTSYAWYVGALAASELDDIAGFESRILRSQATAPNEQWLAQLRVGLVEDRYAEASEPVRAGETTDLRLLVASNQGIASVSRRYVADPQFRQRITDIVESMPEADQARFVSTIRSLAASAAP